MADDLTEEEIEQRERLIDVMMEQARTGQKGIDQDIQRYLQETKTGKAITETGKAASSLTGGFKDSAKALGSSTGNFNDLTSAVTGTINAVSGLLSSIPVVGKAFTALGDAAAETASFAIGQIQSNYESFKELAKAGQIGADGVTGMANRFEQAGLPLATYTKLLGSHSEELAFFSSSALSGGKSFAGMMADMDGDSKQYMRNLGYSIEEIGDAAIEYQVLQRKRGIVTDMDNLQLSRGTANYVEELNMMAKLTGQNVKDLQNQRDEVRADSRFRSRLASLRAKDNHKGAAEMENFAAMIKKMNPEIAKGFMDITSGAINTEAALKLTRSGMLDAAKEAQRGLESGKLDKAQALNLLVDASKKAAEAGGTIANIAGLSDEAAAKFLDYSKLLDFSLIERKSLLAIEKDIAKQKAKPDKTTDQLSTSVSNLERSIAKVNKFFITSPAAVGMLNKFSGAMGTVITKIEDAFGPSGPSKPVSGQRNLVRHQNQGKVNSEKFDVDMLQQSYNSKLKQLKNADGDKALMQKIVEELATINTEMIAKRANVKKLGGKFETPTRSSIPIIAAKEKIEQATKRVEEVLDPVTASTGPKAEPATPRINYGAKIHNLQGAKAIASNEMINFESQARKSGGIDESEKAELTTIANGIMRMNKELQNLRELARQQNDKLDKGNKIASNNG